MATDFEVALLRLKGALRLTTDKEVAEALGMSPNALNERKRRDAFPEDRVRALSRELHFDADYVITGVAEAARELMTASLSGKPMMKVAPEDRALLARWHGCTEADQRLLLDLIKRLTDAKVQDGIEGDGRYPQRAESHPMALHETDPDRAAATAAAQKSATKKR